MRGLLNLRTFSNSTRKYTKVALLGAGGGIGQPLSLLLKHSPYIKSLCLFDMKDMEGQTLDLNHIDSFPEVYSYTGTNQLPSCLDGAEIVIITAGIPRKPGMERKDLFEVNAKLIAEFTEQIVKSTFNPLICVITNPVNSLVPIVGEILKMNKVFDIRKLFGVTTLDIVRANTFYSEKTGFDVRDVHVPVVAGHSGKTIVPLFSLATPKTQEILNYGELIENVQNAGTKVVQAKKGQGSATLSMAYSGFRFINSLLQARLGKQDIIEYGYVYAKMHDDINYFSDPFRLDQEGISEFVAYDKITDNEKALINMAKVELKEEQKMAYDFIKQNYKNISDVGNYNNIIGRASSVTFDKAWVVEDTHKVNKRKEPMPESKTGSHIPPTPQGEGDKPVFKGMQ